jgi:tetratricopeptide (TPR) repeat protein
MSRQPASAGGRADEAEFKKELLSRLGLRTNAGGRDVEAAHDDLVEFLELAPHELKSWAQAQTAKLDEAFALLRGPQKDLVQLAQVAATAQDGPAEASPVPSPAPPDPSAFNSPAAPAALTKSWVPAALVASKPLRKTLVRVLTPLLLVAVVLGVYFSGKSSGGPAISAKATGQQTQASGGARTTAVDRTKVAALMKKVSANPKDLASLQALGDIYFAAADYKTAAVWERAVLGADPRNQLALQAVGAAQFNLGNVAEAKKQWLVAAGLYPKNAEVHYDLGFLYLSQTPPDQANMRAEWKKVVAIDPNSDLAKKVATHLANATSAPTATPSQVTP